MAQEPDGRGTINGCVFLIAMHRRLPVLAAAAACYLSPTLHAVAAEPVPGLPPAVAAHAEESPLREYFLLPTRIVWKSDAGVTNAENLLQPKSGQAVLKEPVPPCVLTDKGSLVLDFGVEIQGYVELFTTMTRDHPPVPVRVRFGESVSEAMSNIGERSAENDHAVRDQITTLPWLGKKTVGPGGFRFVRIDAVDPAQPVSLNQVRAVLQIRDLPQLGSFRCDDERLNRIWATGAYTVHLCMQDYLWDGIKRDRLVWIGDMHPEVSTIDAVFGYQDVVPRSLDLIRDTTPPTEWMNGISSYSMWWIMIQEEWWMQHGRRDYLAAQGPYLAKLLRHLASRIDDHGTEKLDGRRFLDWPTSANATAIHAGLQAMMVLTMEAGQRLSTTLGDAETAKLCVDTAAKLRAQIPVADTSKQSGALVALAGMRDAKEIADRVLKKDGPHGLSTYYGFYVLEALAKAGEIDTALNFISAYWGGMLDEGATTFWEDFDLNWTKNAGRIDELLPPGKKDLHGDFGAYCYPGFRHSFCHGWASGPTAWLSQQVLGVTPLEPGFKKMRVVPQLGYLKWAEGTYPTPLGVVKVRHERQPDGTINTDVQAPAGMEVVRQ